MANNMKDYPKLDTLLTESADKLITAALFNSCYSFEGDDKLYLYLKTPMTTKDRDILKKAIDAHFGKEFKKLDVFQEPLSNQYENFEQWYARAEFVSKVKNTNISNVIDSEKAFSIEGISDDNNKIVKAKPTFVEQATPDEKTKSVNTISFQEKFVETIKAKKKQDQEKIKIKNIEVDKNISPAKLALIFYDINMQKKKAAEKIEFKEVEKTPIVEEKTKTKVDVPEKTEEVLDNVEEMIDDSKNNEQQAINPFAEDTIIDEDENDIPDVTEYISKFDKQEYKPNSLEFMVNNFLIQADETLEDRFKLEEHTIVENGDDNILSLVINVFEDQVKETIEDLLLSSAQFLGYVQATYNASIQLNFVFEKKDTQIEVFGKEEQTNDVEEVEETNEETEVNNDNTVIDKAVADNAPLINKDWNLLYSYQIQQNQFGDKRFIIHIDSSSIYNTQAIGELRNRLQEDKKVKARITLTDISEDDPNTFTIKNVTIKKDKVIEMGNADETKMIFGKDIKVRNTNSIITDLEAQIDLSKELKKTTGVFELYYFNSEKGADSFVSKAGKKFHKMDFVAIDKNEIGIAVSLFTKFSDSEEKAKLELLNSLKENDKILVQGTIEWNKFAQENVISADSIKLLSHYSTPDNSNENSRYEFNVHTKMSQMSAVTNPKEAIARAAELGLAGIAFTDESSTQSYSALIGAQGKYKQLKPVFGAQFNTITDTPTFVYNPNKLDLFDLENATFVAFDTETTGLYPQFDKIIELSAAKFKYKEVEIKKRNKVVGTEIVAEKIDEMTRIINPHQELDQDIIDITSITQTDVDNGVEMEEALQDFMNFVGDENTIIIGQNVGFDLGFINNLLPQFDSIKQNHLNNEVIDTLTLARRVLPNKRSYNLTATAKNLKITLTQAHRAIYDAIATGYVGIKLLEEYKKTIDENIVTGEDLQAQAYNPEHAYQEGFTNEVSAIVKNQAGVKEIYRLVSIAHTEHFYRKSLLYPNEIQENRENLFIGSGGRNSKLWDESIRFGYEYALKDAKEMKYDYIEVLPRDAYNDGNLKEEYYKASLNNLIRISEELNIPIIVTSNAHYLDDKNRKIYELLVAAKEEKPLANLKIRSTEELLEEFTQYVGKEKAQEWVVDNTLAFGKQIQDDIKPVVTKLSPPIIEGADEQMRTETIENAKKMFGNPLPKVVEERLNTELNFIIPKYTVHYLTAQKMVQYANKMGYLVGSRGSVGSSAVAYMMGITEVNALPPHYRSTHGDYVEFMDPKKVKDGFDLPPKEDPNHPGEMLIRDGHNLQFATFMGIKGDKIPDIDLNAPSRIQPLLQLHLREIFGKDHTIRVGTVSGLATGLSKRYVEDYEQSRNVRFTRAQTTYLANRLQGVKKTTGQHPAGIMIIPSNQEILDFTPYQYPADKKESEWRTTHLTKDDMHDALLKMDVLGHDDPMVLHYLQEHTGVDVTKIDVADKKIIELFNGNKVIGINDKDALVSKGVLGIPEFNTTFAMGILSVAKPQSFADLVQISGISHGSGVWEGNAKELIQNGTATLAEVIGSRDKLLGDIINFDMPLEFADNIVQLVKKGKPIPEEANEQMLAAGVPKWYIESIAKIGYMYPAAHAIAYVTSALRIAYFKIYHPAEFYAAIFTYRYSDFDVRALATNDQEVVRRAIGVANADGKDDRVSSLKVADEAIARGIKFAKPSLMNSEIDDWEVDKETGEIIIPLSAVDGVGAGAAEKIVEYRKENNSLPNRLLEFKKATKANKRAIESLENAGLIKVKIDDPTDEKSDGTIIFA